MPAYLKRRHWHLVAPAAHPAERILTLLPGATVEASFDDWVEAETAYREAERHARALVNPFRCGVNLADLTRLPHFAFKDYLLELGVKPAKADSFARIHWDRWWDTLVRTAEPEVPERVWSVLDRVRFYALEHRPPDSTAFVVLEALVGREELRLRYGWRAPEGGVIRGIYRSEADAWAARQLLPPCAAVPGRNLFTRAGGAFEPVDQVAEIDCDFAPDAVPKKVWCLARRALFVAPRYDHGVQGPQYHFDPVAGGWGGEDRLVPEGLFGTEVAASLAKVQAERELRRSLNPFRFLDLSAMTRRPQSLKSDFSAMGLPPLPRDNGPQVAWWNQYVQPEGDEVFHAAYDRLELLRFYKAVPWGLE